MRVPEQIRQIATLYVHMLQSHSYINRPSRDWCPFSLKSSCVPISQMVRCLVSRFPVAQRAKKPTETFQPDVFLCLMRVISTPLLLIIYWAQPQWVSRPPPWLDKPALQLLSGVFAGVAQQHFCFATDKTHYVFAPWHMRAICWCTTPLLPSDCLELFVVGCKVN